MPSSNILIINGKRMPFTAEELREVLRVMKKSFLEVTEQSVRKDEVKVLGHLLDALKEY